ncbi:MAG: TRZ/ATZ family hydrolase [Chromatiales bacterium]|jgi:5-methylthioadenosine/S-adenosylhomocysteine deaminase|nr:TRZ/ATZ family hydrolase [Chromatiales bacterium]
MQHADVLIEADWIIPVEPFGQELRDHAVIVTNGRIVEVCPSTSARERYAPTTHHRLSGHALVPGLVNTHGHAAMALLRGIADDLPLMEWLSKHIWPAEARLVNEAFVYDGTRLAVSEMMRGGTTCFNDMYFFAGETARAASELGIRAVIGLIALDFPTAVAQNADEYIARGIEIHDQVRHLPLVSTAWAPHAPYTISDKPLTRIQVLAEEMDVPIHIHVHETSGEVESAVAESGRRPLARLHELNLLSPRLIAVHMTQLKPAEIELAAQCGIHIVHCPESNLKLASGACPVHTLMEAGVNVALGTDGAASNNDLDMFAEMRTAALFGKFVANDAGAVPAATALKMATLNGALALGLADDIGSIEPGKAADLCAIDLRGAATQPVYDATSTVVYSANASHVRHVWVAGSHVVDNGDVVSTDDNLILARANEWRMRAQQADQTS